MFIDTSTTKAKSGNVYTRVLLRTSSRKNGKVVHGTVGNLSHCTPQEIAATKYAFLHKDTFPPPPLTIRASDSTGDQPCSSRQGLSIGAIGVVYQISKRLGIALLRHWETTETENVHCGKWSPG
jgi:hypothetical protein